MASIVSREEAGHRVHVMGDRLAEECGVFGVYGHPEAANMTYLGLYALQHRGQESAGIVVSDGERLRGFRDMGLVADVFDESALATLTGHAAVGHVRYSTTGANSPRNAQPVLVDYARGSLAVAHNGNVVNAAFLRQELEASGSIFQSTNDSEVIVHLIARSRKRDFTDSIIDALQHLRGAYSLLIMNKDTLVAARDPNGFRPLCLGTLDGATVFASESCAFDIIDAEYVRDVEPGEVVAVDRTGLSSYHPFPPSRTSLCIFELIYFSRPDSRVFGRDVQMVRHRLGTQLARESGVDADMVIPVPDSSTAASVGYSHESGIPFMMGLIRNHYVGRTFIEPSQSIRDFGAKIKYNPLRQALRGKRAVVVDDSIVRGTTGRKIITMVRKAGATAVHMRVSSPPIVGPCYYGIDTPTRAELIASSHTAEEVGRRIGANSLQYLSLEGLVECAGGGSDEFCLACFNRDYPVEPCDEATGQISDKASHNHMLFTRYERELKFTK